MKLIKCIFFTLAGLLLGSCLIIVICALNPSLTQMLAERVQAAQQGVSAENREDVPDVDPARGEGTPAEAIPGINVDWLSDRGLEGYLVPAVLPENLPTEVSGLWGYEPVSWESQEIIQEEADNLTDILASDLPEAEFFLPDIYYPYYLMLEPDLQLIYKQIYTNAMSRIISFVPVADVGLDELSIAFEAVFNDHPELTYVETEYSCLCLDDGTIVEVSLVYNEIVDDFEVAGPTIVQWENELIQAGSTFGTDYEKEKFIHDYLAATVEYDMNAPMNQSAYSVMGYGRSVCAGYARAFQLMMQNLGIPCYYCTGFAGEDHAWNIILLDGKYYNVDVTWDDTNPLTYDYFNKTDAEFSDTHVRTGLSVYLPACTGTLYVGNPQDVIAAQQTEEEEADAGEDGESETPGGGPSIAGDLVNSEPQLPLVWESRGKSEGESEEELRETQLQANLNKAGIKEEDVLETMEEYYNDCESQLKAVGVGDTQFSNVIPSSLYSAVERSYSSGSYWNGYVEDALRALKVENFSIQLQVRDLGGGYYRLYHNIYTY